MKYAIVISDEARKNIANASLYYHKISPVLKDSFLEKVIQTINLLQNNPKHYQFRYKNIHIANIERFPFSVHFIMEDTIIYVLKVLHQKQYYRN